MIRFAPFLPEHLTRLEVQAAQAELAAIAAQPVNGQTLRWGGVAETCIEVLPRFAPLPASHAVSSQRADQSSPLGPDYAGARIIACAGLLHQWPGRALAWAVVGRTEPRQWIAIARRMAAMIGSAERCGMRRIEAAADAEFPQGCRLLEMLGFEIECRARAYSPAGRDHFLYAKIAESGIA